MSIIELTTNEVNNLKNNKDYKLIDVRTPGEFSSSHIEGSVNLPINSSLFNDFKDKTQNFENIIFICQGGTRAKNACNEILSKSKSELSILKGGLNEWKASGLPTIDGSGTISLERQVRIAAGMFVLLGTLLGIFISTNYLIIPAFVGAGLMFAGITNTCGLAMILARMPWNNSNTCNNQNCCNN